MADIQQPNNPLHGVTLESILIQLQERYGWQELGKRIRINCFVSNPSLKSSLNFLRRTPWARKKVEDLYISTFSEPQQQKNMKPMTKSKN